jgi:PAT family acetyl-CoA transporter-like MFS transporter 1
MIVAILSVCIYPFTFKLFTAPLIDTFYSPSIGRRKTYILPLQYAIGFLYLLLGVAKLSVLISNKQVLTIAAIGFVAMLLNA